MASSADGCTSDMDCPICSMCVWEDPLSNKGMCSYVPYQPDGIQSPNDGYAARYHEATDQYLPYVDGDFPAYLHAEKVNRFCLTDRWTFSLDHLSEMRSKVLEREPGTVPVKGTVWRKRWGCASMQPMQLVMDKGLLTLTPLDKDGNLDLKKAKARMSWSPHTWSLKKAVVKAGCRDTSNNRACFTIFRKQEIHEQDKIRRRDPTVSMLAAPDGDDEDDTPSAAKASDGDRKKGKRRPRVLLELFVADAPTAQAWAQRAVLQQELFFGEVSTQLDIPLARLGSYAAKDIDSVATDFRTAEGSPLLSEFVLRGSTLRPEDPSLLSNEFLSSASTNPDHHSTWREYVGQAASNNDDEEVCFWTTDRGSVCVSAGNEPDVNAAPLWEAGGSGTNGEKKGGPRWRVFKGWGTGRKTTVTRRGASNSAGNRARRDFKGWRGRRNDDDGTEGGNVDPAPGESSWSSGDDGGVDEDGPSIEEEVQEVTRSAKVFMERGRVNVETETTTVTRDEITQVTEITWQSPRPKGAWKTWLSPFLEEGRQIRDARLTMTHNGEIDVQTPNGRQLWSVPLPDRMRDEGKEWLRRWNSLARQ